MAGAKIIWGVSGVTHLGGRLVVSRRISLSQEPPEREPVMTMSKSPFEFVTEPTVVFILAGLALWSGLVALMMVAF